MTNHLENRLSEALHDLAGNSPHHLDLDKIERRGRRAKTRTVLTRTGVTLGVAALVAAAAGLGTAGRAAPKHGVDAAGGTLRATSPAPPKHGLNASTTGTTARTRMTGSATLIRLAGYVLAGDPPTGDATEVISTTTNVGKASTVGADLWTDDGRYFYSDDPSGLGAQVRAGNSNTNGVFSREVAIAQYAANGGDLATAQRRMAVAALDPGKPYRIVTTAPTRPPGLTDAQLKSHRGTGGPTVVVLGSYDWSNSLDALLAGAGRPDVRAGVLRILSTVPDVTVTQTTTDGKPTLTLTDTAKGWVSTYVESIVIGASDGIPVELHGNDLSDPSVAVSVAYDVSRVTVSDLN